MNFSCRSTGAAVMPDAMSHLPAMPSAKVMPCAYPLDDFYARAGKPLPPIEAMPGESVPEPFRSLLVHDSDMTSTLEGFHHAAVVLEVLGRDLRGESYFREVVLRLVGSGKPVEFGAIKISLNLLPPEARHLILEERLPLGHILKQCKVPHTSRPKAFIKVAPDDVIRRALGFEGADALYGRRNTLLDPQQRPLAEIVEILPPVFP